MYRFGKVHVLCVLFNYLEKDIVLDKCIRYKILFQSSMQLLLETLFTPTNVQRVTLKCAQK